MIRQTMRLNAVGLLSVALLVVCWCGMVDAQVPHKLNYQGYLTDLGGTPVQGSVPMVFKLYTAASGGAALYAETQTVSFSDGVFNVVIGAVTPLNLAFDVPYYLGVSAGADPEMTPRQLVAAGAYSLRSANADALAPAATVAGSQIAGAISTATLPAANLTGTIGTAQIANNAVTQGKLSPSSGAAAGKVLGTDGTNLQWQTAAGGGSVTSLTQGTGVTLTPNPIIASGTIGLPATQLLPTTPCSNTQIPKWNGAAWTCAADNATGGGGIVGGAANQTARHDGINWVGSPVLTNDGTIVSTTGQLTVGGELRLPAAVRVTANGVRFIHNFGNFNTFVGNSAGNLTMTGAENTGVGAGALPVNTTGSFNAAFGNSTGLNNTTGGANSFFGDSAGRFNTTGNYNAFFGYNAGYFNVNGGANAFFGGNAGGNNTSGNFNAVFGDSAGLANTTGGSNAFFGYAAGEANTASNNAFFGREAGQANTTGTPNSFYGTTAGAANTTGNFNAFFGASAGTTNSTGSENSFFGANAGRANTTAGFGSFFGNTAGFSNTIGSANSFFGWRAGYANTIGGSNAFFGFGAGAMNVSGTANAFFGLNAGTSNVSGGLNAFFGKDAGFNNTGSSNAFFGYGAGQNNVAGHNNTYVGPGAGGSNTSGNYNTFVGDIAGTSNTTGTNNTYIGAGAGGTPGLTYATAIGAGALVEQSNSVVLGGAFDNVGIGTTSPDPTKRLVVVGQVAITGTLFKGGGMFRIDHPVEPAQKYLSHSFVESPDMKNIYDGIAVLDANGEAAVELPPWFGALNRDFRYQLTCIGGFAAVYIADEIADNQFRIAGGRAGMKVSWQVTGVRQDAWANANRIVVEEDKPDHERGFYLHPEVHGALRSKGVDFARRPESGAPPRVAAIASSGQMSSGK